LVSSAARSSETSRIWRSLWARGRACRPRRGFSTSLFLFLLLPAAQRFCDRHDAFMRSSRAMRRRESGVPGLSCPLRSVILHKSRHTPSSARPSGSAHGHAEGSGPTALAKPLGEVKHTARITLDSPWRRARITDAVPDIQFTDGSMRQRANGRRSM